MHVILLSHEYPPFIFGGVGTFVKSLAHGLLRCGIEVTVIAGYPVPNTSGQQVDINQEQNGEGVLRFPYPIIPPRHTMFQILNFKRFHRIIGKIGADVIHGQSGVTFPALLNLQNLAPIIVTFHTSPRIEMMMSSYSLTRGGSMGDFCTYTLGYPFWSYTYRKEFKSSDAAVAVSNSLMKDLTYEMGAKSQGKMLYIHNGVDVEMLEREYSNVYYDEGKTDHLVKLCLWLIIGNMD